MFSRSIPKKDSAAAWFFCFLAGTFFFCEIARVTMFNSLAPSLMKYYSINAIRLSVLAATYSLANLVFVYPAGLLIDKFSLKKFFLLAVATNTGASCVFYLSSNIYVAQLSLFVAGLGNAFSFVGSMKFITTWLSSRKGVLATGLLVAYSMVGGMLAQTPATFVIANFGWRAPILLLIIVELCIFIFILFFVPSRAHQIISQALKAVGVEHFFIRRALRNFWYTIKSSLCCKQNWLAGAYASLLNLPIVILGALWGTSYLVQVFSFPQYVATNVVSTLFLGVILGAPFIGWFTNKIQSRRIPMLSCAIGAVFISGLLVVSQHLSATWCYLLFFGLGFCSSGQVLSFTVIVESNASQYKAASLGLSSMLILVGWAVFQPLFSWVMELGWDGMMVQGVPFYGSTEYRNALLILPLTSILGAVLVGFIKETYGRENS